MESTILTQEAKQRIIKNKPLRRALYDRWDFVNQKTLYRWFAANKPQLTHPDTISLICAYEKCEPSDITVTVEHVMEREPVFA